MKRLFLVLALAVTVQAQAQDELPTPEAFAKDCWDDKVFFAQQITETLKKAEANPDGMGLQLRADIETTISSIKLKNEICDSMAEMLGEDYVNQLAKVGENSEIKLALYKAFKAFERVALQDISNIAEEARRRRRVVQELIAIMLAEENKLPLNTLTDEELRSEGEILIADVYVHAIRQKIERNWLKPAGSGKMPVCEVRVLQGPGGIILDVEFGACDGSTATYRASIENAVYRAEPLPTPGDPELFARELNFYFNPSVQ
jgi:hypothetical protein